MFPLQLAFKKLAQQIDVYFSSQQVLKCGEEVAAAFPLSDLGTLPASETQVEDWLATPSIVCALTLCLCGCAEVFLNMYIYI